MPIHRWDNVVTGPLGERMARFLETYPGVDGIYITSARDGNHGGQSHHYGLTYAGSPTAALDIGAGGVGVGSPRMRDLAKWLYDNFAEFSVELIHSTPFTDDDGFYVKNQVRNPGGSVYGGPAAIGHYDHVHWATSEELMTRLEQRAGHAIPARLRANVMRPLAPAAIANTAPVWGWDASDYDWDPKRGPMNLVEAQRDGMSFFVHKATEGQDWQAKNFQEALERARGAEIPVLGAYHYLWPNAIEEQVNWWMDYVDRHTPWWKDVPWIWQIDAEKSPSMPRPPSPEEISRTVELVRQRMADQGANGYVIAYAPRWLYGDTLTSDYDIWNSNYNGSGAPRPFKEQYQGVGDSAAGWNAMSGRKPTILQFASDGVVGTQNTCDVNKFDGDLYALLRKCGREPSMVPSTLDTSTIEAFETGLAVPQLAEAPRDTLLAFTGAAQSSAGMDDVGTRAVGGGLLLQLLERLAITYEDADARSLLAGLEKSQLAGSGVSNDAPVTVGTANGHLAT